MGLMSIDRVCIPAGWLDPISDNSNLVGNVMYVLLDHGNDVSSLVLYPERTEYFGPSR